MDWSVQATRLRTLEGIGYMGQMESLARSLTAPFWWHGIDGAGIYRILGNGTVCFINTAKKIVAVSARHVYRGYLADKGKYKEFSCQFGSSTIEPEKYVLDENEELDLVTFEIPDILRVATNASVHGPERWPTDELKKDEVVVCGGYPGVLREEKVRTAEFAFAVFATKVLSVSPESIKLHVDLPKVRWGSGVPEHERRTTHFGGMSGGPIYRVKGPIERLELAGFIFESSLKAPTPEEPNPIGFIFGKHAWRVDSDGRIVTQRL